MSNTTYEFTIYIAGKGSRLQDGSTSAAGHIWYGLSGQDRSYGFGPENPKNTAFGVKGIEVDNDTQNYQDVAFKTTYQVTEAQYQKLLAFGERPFAHGFHNIYSAHQNSCVDFVWAALDHAGISRDKGFEGALIPTQNRDKLQQFVDLPIIEQVDWLDVGGMLRQLNPNLSPAQLEALIRAGSADSTGGEEGVLDAVRRLVLGPNINPTKVSTWTATLSLDAARVDFVNNNKALQAHRSFKLLAGQLSVSANEVSVSEAKSDFAAFLSLHNLSPIVFRGGASANATLMATHNALAQQWRKFDEHFSDQWLQDRSAMHGYLLQINEKDLASRLLPAQGKTSTYYEDMGAAEYVQVGNATPAKRERVIFVDDAGREIAGGDLNDRLYGGKGQDTLISGAGDDWLEGGAGNDVLDGGEGNDMLFGGHGDDTLIGGAGDDWLEGGAGNDNLDGGSGNNTLKGGLGHDSLRVESGHNILDGGQGEDILEGGQGQNILKGGQGDDQLYSGSGRNQLQGGQGNDWLVDNSQSKPKSDTGDTGDGVTRNWLEGGSGFDRYLIGQGYNTIRDSDGSGQVFMVNRLTPVVQDGGRFSLEDGELHTLAQAGSQSRKGGYMNDINCEFARSY